MKRTLPLVMVLAGLLSIVFGLGIWADRTAESLPVAIRLPDVLAKRPLTSSHAGAAALDELTRLHGRHLPVNSARSAIYGSEGQIQLWVARAPSTPVAARLMAAMNAAIAQGRSPFTPLGEIRQGERVIYELAGFGGLHYYFQSADLLVWLAVDDAHSEAALGQTLEFYP